MEIWLVPFQREIKILLGPLMGHLYEDSVALVSRDKDLSMIKKSLEPFKVKSLLYRTTNKG